VMQVQKEDTNFIGAPMSLSSSSHSAGSPSLTARASKTSGGDQVLGVRADDARDGGDDTTGRSKDRTTLPI